MSRNNSGLLVIAGSIAGKLKYFSRQVLKNCSHIHRRAGTDALCVVPLAENTMNSANCKLKTSSRWTAFGFAAAFAWFTTTRHDHETLAGKLTGITALFACFMPAKGSKRANEIRCLCALHQSACSKFTFASSGGQLFMCQPIINRYFWSCQFLIPTIFAINLFAF